MIVLEVAYEMYARGYEFLPARLGISDGTKFGTKDGKVVLPLWRFPAWERRPPDPLPTNTRCVRTRPWMKFGNGRKSIKPQSKSCGTRCAGRTSGDGSAEFVLS